MSVITVKNLNFKYPQNDKAALSNVSFGIEKGSYVAIVGYNGCGKSTLARLICGLEVPDSGTIEIEENNRIGIVFQSPKDQLVSGIVSRDTAFGAQNLGLSEGEVELRVIESLNIVDMLDRAGSSTSALSLGQTQKVALSGVLALRPEILILDEAVSMLDPESRKEILEFLRYWHKCGNTIIQITHDMEVLSDADCVIGIEEGQVFYYGTQKAFLSNEENVKRICGEPLPPRWLSSPEGVSKPSLEDVALKLENVSYTHDAVHGVFNINLSFPRGTLTALTGPSGAGKSTLLEICSGLAIPQEGSVYCSSSQRPVLAQQNAQAALFEPFAADDVAFGPRNSGMSGKPLVERVKQSMNAAAIPFEQFGERRTFELSGGEQRRLSIAGILAMDSDVILFDEPTAGLDSRTRNEVMAMFRRLTDEGKTVIFSTHKRDEADFADREIVIKEGTVVECRESPVVECAAEQRVSKPQSNALSELTPSDSATLISGLKKLSMGLSRSQRRKTSPVEKLSPALRIVLFFALFVFSLAVRPLWLCAVALVVGAVYGLLCGFSLRRLLSASLKILPFLLFFSIFQMIFHPALPGETHFTEWRWFMVTPSKLLFCLAAILRTDASLACISGFFVSTPEYDLMDGLNVLLTPLRLCRVPVRYLILIIEIIFRFIPLLVDEAVSILKTQTIRGGLGNVKGKMAKIRAVVPLIVPLVIQAIKRSEALADAITMRCFK
ncbi:energy-coupling factor transport system ATP-binding protein [Treponema bryantii]|uniref:Energy-coupling factor transport system ATP-binding protein n=1 Tax=Treponema bryantii TaxID=163 RepID=A0A1I3LBG4_9SPIR|nr:energy-coupling factor transporter ATPase [Treponema bryantii]SFI82077.1 energy-coupling factor transport system ATP-binding protein [Treponema bryantii]